MKLQNYQEWFFSAPITDIISEYKTNLKPFTKNKDYRKRLQQLAEAITNNAFAYRGHSLDLVVRYYAYVHLDPRHPAKDKGQYKYILPSGKVVNFSHRPYYVGKGKKGRMYSHLKEAKRSKGRSLKLNTIRKLQKLKLKPIIIRTPSTVAEAMAFAFEIDLIAGIGRRDLNLGPLTNLTDGGEGTTNPSAMTRKKLSVSVTLSHKNMPKEKKKARSAKISKRASAAYANFSEEKKVQVKKLNSEGVTRAWTKLTPKERKVRDKLQQAGVDKITPEKKREMIAKQKASTAAKPIVSCPHCGTQGKGGNFTRHHFDKCKLVAKPKPTVTCPHCGKIGSSGAGGMTKFHFDNCKFKVAD